LAFIVARTTQQNAMHRSAPLLFDMLELA